MVLIRLSAVRALTYKLGYVYMRAHLRFAKRVVESNFHRLAFPYKLTFVTTYWCNYRCKTCNIWERRPKNELSTEEIEKFFARSNRFSWIDFTGGEVWLRKDFVQIVEAAVHHCRDLLLVHFPTNGYMTKQIVSGVERIMKSRPRNLIVTVSTDGDEATNDDVRGIKGGWRRQIETFKQLHAIKGVEVVLGMTLSAYNADQYERAFAAAKAECPWLTPKDYHINIVHESSHYYGNGGSGQALRGRTQDILDTIAFYRRERGMPRSVVDYLERRYLQHAEAYLKDGHTPVRCHALHSSCFVDSWGDVYPCGMYEAKLGSLREYEYNLERIWNLPETRRLQKEIWKYQCPQCWTPCEAYQSLLGNLLGMRNYRPAQDASKAGRSVALPVLGEREG